MSQAEDLLNSLTVYEDEPHIVINADRTLTIPAGLKKIAVQHDHNIETVTIDCPRYWDGIDMSSMEFYINYKRADGELGSYIVRNPIIDSSDDRIVHFDWTISSHVTAVKGKLSFLVCIIDTDSDGTINTHWNSELSDEMYIAEGLEVHEHIEESYSDVISQLIHMSEQTKELVDEKITAEIKVREEADRELGNRITVEQGWRGAADDELDEKITAETQARIDEDASLHSSIDATNINMEMGDRELQAAIDAETQARIEADERLKYYGNKDIVPSPESYFTVNETGETITGLTDTGKTQTELIIPYNVTRIGQFAFIQCSNLASVIIPNSVTYIDSGAFVECTGLTNAVIPNSVTNISGGTFSGCTGLTDITIPNSVTSIVDETFSGCTGLTDITIPNSVTSIANNAFDNCTNLTIYCEQGSYAETYAQEQNIPVVYTDVKAEMLDKKQDRVEISEYPEDNTELIYDLSAMHNNELRTKSTFANGITFIIPNEVHPDDYVTSLSFNTGDTAPQIGYSDTGIINWIGTDCSTTDGKSEFTPSANMHYDIVIYYNGSQLVGLVNGYTPATVVNSSQTEATS